MHEIVYELNHKKKHLKPAYAFHINDNGIFLDKPADCNRHNKVIWEEIYNDFIRLNTKKNCKATLGHPREYYTGILKELGPSCSKLTTSLVNDSLKFTKFAHGRASMRQDALSNPY